MKAERYGALVWKHVHVTGSFMWLSAQSHTCQLRTMTAHTRICPDCWREAYYVITLTEAYHMITCSCYHVQNSYAAGMCSDLTVHSTTLYTGLMVQSVTTQPSTKLLFEGVLLHYVRYTPDTYHYSLALTSTLCSGSAMQFQSTLLYC
jgi:hypothetical protein